MIMRAHIDSQSIKMIQEAVALLIPHLTDVCWWMRRVSVDC